MVLKKRVQNEAEVPISGGRAGESGEWMMLLYPRVNDGSIRKDYTLTRCAIA